MFLGRQPIVNTAERVVAYELLYRAAAGSVAADVPDTRHAVSHTLAGLFAAMGAEKFLGDCRGFVNVDRFTLLEGLLESLPRELITIEILECVPASDDVLAACQRLRAAGYTLALDDWVPDDPRGALLPLCDVVKVDLPSVAPGALRKLVRELRSAPRTLLAEKVETREEHERCRALGFDLFQGFYFARPEVLERRRIDPARHVVMRALQLLGQDADTRLLCATIEQEPALGLNLLRIVNSAATVRPMKVSRVRDALVQLGRSQLQRWLLILLFAGAGGGGFGRPLLQTAARRGRMMERLHECEESGGKAFLTGMASLLGGLLGLSDGELVEELNLDGEIAAALTKRRGMLGHLLQLVERLDAGDFDGAEQEVAELGLQTDAVAQAERESFLWVRELRQRLS